MTNTTPPDILEGFLLSDKATEQSIHPAPRTQDYKTLFSSNAPLPASVRNSSFAQLNDHYKDSSIDGLLRELQGGKVMSMQELVDDINTLIQERLALKKEVFSDADRILMGMDNFLNSKNLQPVEEVTIKEKLLDIESFKLQEKINAFRDIAALKKELRDRAQELKEKQNNINIIDQLLQ